MKIQIEVEISDPDIESFIKSKPSYFLARVQAALAQEFPYASYTAFDVTSVKIVSEDLP